MGDTTHISETISAGQLRAFIERVERLEEEIKALNGDKSEVYAEMRGAGFDVKAVRQCVAARKLDSAEREERNAIFDLYWSALTGSPRVHVHEGTESTTPKASNSKASSAETGDLGTTPTDPQEQPETAQEQRANVHPQHEVRPGSTSLGTKQQCNNAGVTVGGDERGTAVHSQSDAASSDAATEHQAPQSVAAPIPEGIPAFLLKERKPLRPNCLHPDNCAGYGSHTCHSCTRAMAESEAAA